jgi:methionine synthase II (cobalamin-independent)
MNIKNQTSSYTQNMANIADAIRTEFQRLIDVSTLANIYVDTPILHARMNQLKLKVEDVCQRNVELEQHTSELEQQIKELKDKLDESAKHSSGPKHIC